MVSIAWIFAGGADPYLCGVARGGRGDFARAALLVMRERACQLEKLPPLLKHLKKDHPITLVFIERNEEPCFAATARRAVRTHSGRIIRAREFVPRTRANGSHRKLADVVIDTTQFNVHECSFITARFKNPDKRPMLVSVVSFGYRYGVRRTPTSFSTCRFLPNPHFARCGRSPARTRKSVAISAPFPRR